MYDTRVYKERRKAKFQSDPEYRLREQQRHRERYQKRKAEKLHQEEVVEQLLTEPSADEMQEMVLDIRPNELIPEVSSSPSNLSTISNHQPPSTSDEAHLPANPSEDFQTVSIKLPASMAVLVVPVNLTSVSDDDAMQLQQLGKRVAIIRGAMTNVAEFQVLPALTFDASSRVIGMDTDIRQIVTSTGKRHDTGPTIQITPQVIESTGPELPSEPQAAADIPKPKLYVYIHMIKCGRCLLPFDDLMTLGRHQKNLHNMRPIDVTNTSHEDSNKSRVIDAAQLLSMDDKIAARRLPKVVPQKVGTTKRSTNNKGANAAAGRGKTARGVRVVDQIPDSESGQIGIVRTEKGKVPKKIVKEGLYVCQFCSLTFMSAHNYSLHFRTHEMEEEVVVTTRSSLTEYVEEELLEEEELHEPEEVVEESLSLVKKPSLKDELTTGEHIITDGSGNQIVVHVESQEQLQELLVSLEREAILANGGAEGGSEIVVNERGDSEMVLGHHQGVEEDMIVEEELSGFEIAGGHAKSRTGRSGK